MVVFWHGGVPRGLQVTGYRLQEAGYDGTMVLSWRSSVQFMISGQLICFQGRFFATSPTIQSTSTGIYLV